MRVVLSNRTTGKWRVRLRDLDTGNIVFQSENQGAFVSSANRCYVRFSVEACDVGEAGVATSVAVARVRRARPRRPDPVPDQNAGRHPGVVSLRSPVRRRACLPAALRDAYPLIHFVTQEELIEQKLAETVYATYCLGLFFDNKDCIHQPTDFRHAGLHRTAAYILGVGPTEQAPRLVLSDASRPIPKPYVCIGLQSSTQCKTWNNPDGWRAVVAFLKAEGYRVVCIEKSPVQGTGMVWTHIPHGTKDETGDRLLVERARWLRHASAFVGLSSGLSWLAWAAGWPMVMISGFAPTNEFTTTDRVINAHACNSCWNDVRRRFDLKDYLWCPRRAGTPLQFEPTRLITPAQMIATLKRIPRLADWATTGAPTPKSAAETAKDVRP